MNLSVGLAEGHAALEVELIGGPFTDTAGKSYPIGRYKFDSQVTLIPSEFDSCAFGLAEVTIGSGFHWERKERQVFRGTLRLVMRARGLTVINDISLEEYVTSVISSEMSASCPLELLKAHAVISRSWLWFPKAHPRASRKQPHPRDAHEILRWYGREAHADFDVCADDHCQRYQGITKVFSEVSTQAVRATAGQLLRYKEAICDARFAKACGGITDRYATAWEDESVPYLESSYDGDGKVDTRDLETWIRSSPPAYCNTNDKGLLSRILPGFDQETRDFYRWRVEYTADEVAELINARLGIDLGRVSALQPLERGPSGRIYRLKVAGESNYLIIGKELEIRRALSRSHLYSSAFVVDKADGRFILTGAGWGHGVGLCQIGAAVMACQGKSYLEILQHYYRGTTVSA